MINFSNRKIAQDLITEDDRKKADFCRNSCPVCRYAREKQSGWMYEFVKYLEEDKCPYCQAYEKVYGKKAHEPVN